ncbi:MAG TPA: xanthine dehydrogenase family protein molybdopterin-binding subunit, partial [Stellaceae bacterium]|nr:xanthine dehydrogenase family protein molybdopterin-binding subunit [Stellaceae bacterium]
MAAYIGTPTSRVDGRAKVTGAAKYAGEFNQPGLAYGSLVTATIAKGRIRRIDAGAALAVPGVIEVLTHQNRPPMAERDEAHKDEVAPDGSPFRPLFNDRILFNGQPIGLVLAEDWETARFAATLVRVEYEAQPHMTDLHARRDKAVALAEDTFALTPAKPRGEAEKAFAAAEIRHEAEYFSPVEHHNPMEPYATTVIWEGGGKLRVYDKTQGVQNVQRYLCGVFGMKPEDLRVTTPYVGGAFGSGLRPQHNAAIAVLAAKALQRSVRLVLSRQQMYSLGYRPATIQRIALGARRDGSLDAVTHEAIGMTSAFEDFARKDTIWSGVLYKSATARYTHRLAKLDVATPCDMRAPGAASGVFGLECAMDELAVALDLDPVELRRRAYSERDQNDGSAFSSKQLMECYRQGAESFGWSKRNPAPRSMRDGKELVGWGMATGIWEALEIPMAVRIVLTANGHAEVACGTMDIGTGTYTIMAQVAADMLGLPLENVSVKLGDSALPRSPVEGGSWTAASVASAIQLAAGAIRGELLRHAKDMPASPLAGLRPEDVTLAGGTIASRQDPRRAVSIAEAMRHGGIDRLEQEKTFEPKRSGHAQNTHSAVFAEVKVDDEIGIIRVTRLVSAVAAGRILNTKTARSQIIGSLIWGIGMALHEETLIDHRYGRIMNADIAEYHVPVNADVHDIEVIFVDEPDDKINPLGIKGVGEIGI